MKIALFEINGEPRVGIVENGNVIDIIETFRDVLVKEGYSEDEADETVDSLIIYSENFVLTWNTLESILKEVKDNIKLASKHMYPLNEIKLLPPIIQPQKIIGVALNYRDLADQLGKEYPEKARFYLKAPSSIIGPGESIILPKVAEKIDYEAELVIVIKEEAKDLEPDEADQVILGYTIGNDITARDIQYNKHTFHSWAKSIDTFTPIGPWIVTTDEIKDPQNLKIRLWINNELYQDSTTANMIRNVREIVSEASQYMTLFPGDLIFTGTPAGTGFALNPPRFLKDGDVVRIEIEGIGILENPVKSYRKP